MMKAQHVIWSNYDLDYERDWKGLLEEEYPDMTEEERELLMHEMNNSYLDDERCNLNIQLDCPIIVIADLGLWHGRASGYREIESGNVRDCLYSGRSIEYSTIADAASNTVLGSWMISATCAARQSTTTA